MALTWEFYVAIVLVLFVVLIVVAFIYLLFRPQSNLFDRLKKMLKGEGADVAVNKGRGVSPVRRGGVGNSAARGVTSRRGNVVRGGSVLGRGNSVSRRSNVVSGRRVRGVPGK